MYGSEKEPSTGIYAEIGQTATELLYGIIIIGDASESERRLQYA
jgi:hypothetical protein